jgi:hypothetical protein
MDDGSGVARAQAGRMAPPARCARQRARRRIPCAGAVRPGRGHAARSAWALWPGGEARA